MAKQSSKQILPLQGDKWAIAPKHIHISPKPIEEVLHITRPTQAMSNIMWNHLHLPEANASQEVQVHAHKEWVSSMCAMNMF